MPGCACFGDHRVVRRIYLPDAVEPRQRQHDLIATVPRHLSADQTRIAALRNDGSTGLTCDSQYFCDLVCATGLENQRGASMPSVPRLADVWLDLHLIAQRV